MIEKKYFIGKELQLCKNKSGKFSLITLSSDSLKVLEKEKAYLEKYLININFEVKNSKEINSIDFSIDNVSELFCLKDVEIGLDYDKFLILAINISKALQTLHKNDIFHTNITIESIFLDENYNAYIFDFQNAIDYTKQSTGLSSIYFKNLALLNKSPEQLGRINNEVDLRSDIYSLGLIFYELLTKKHVFEAKDDLETLHNILTKDINELENIPINISNIVVRLLKKEVLFRYQSINGLLFDLIQLQEDYTKNYILGLNDISSRLQFPQKVYGRKKETKKLVRNYKKVSKGKKETIFISGYSGVGKSSLIDELKNRIVNTNSYFISSKFDQYNKDLPYYAISEAFSVLVKQVLIKSQKELDQIKNRLLKNLKGNGQILIDLIPNLVDVLGKQKKVKKLPSSESENRFNQVFLDFIKTIVTKETPLVLVIDDLQWMDLATLKLLENIINADELKYVFILAAYRSNEIKNNFALKNIIDNNKNIDLLELKALKKKSLNSFLEDCLFLKKEKLEPLVDEIYIKTGANPFFFRQFIKKLYDDGLMYFSYEAFAWNFDINKIRQENITDNVASLMLENISQIDIETLKCLQIASCLGANFDLKVLEKIEDISIYEIINKLKKTFSSALLIPLEIDINNTKELENSKEIKIKFLHDQVQQAVYSTIKKDDLFKLHYKIGKTLLSLDKKNINYFEVLSHLNFSKNKVENENEKIFLIKLNIEASSIAKTSTAYDGALNYLDVVKELLEQFDVDKNYRMYMDILLDYVELLYLTGDFEKAKEYESKVFSLVKNIDDEIKLRRILVVQYTRIGKLDDSIIEGLKSLELLGMKISKDIRFEDVGTEIQEVQSLVKLNPFSKISKLPEIEDEKILKTLDILMEMQPGAYNSGSLIFPITILRLLKLTIVNGNTYLSYYIFMMYALMNTKVLKDYDMAFEASKYALDLKENYEKSILTGRFNMMLANFVMPWQNKLHKSQNLRIKAYEECLEFGDYYWGIHSFIFGFYANLSTCKDLDDLYSQTKSVANVSKKINQISQYYLCNVQMNLIKVLNGKLDNQKDLNHKKGFEQKVLNEYNKQNYMCGKYDLIVARLFQGFMFENYEIALEVSLNENLDSSSLDEGIFHEAFYKVFNILSILLLDLNGNLKEENRKKYYEYIDSNISFIEIWKSNSSDLFYAIDLLIKALKSTLNNDIKNSMQFFEEAIDYLKNKGFILFEAVANELYSKFWTKKGNLKIADLYINEAINLYKSFKAYAKVEFLENKLSYTNKNEVSSTTSVDLDVIIKSSNLISKEMRLKKIVENILDMVYRFSGAQNGFMFLNDSKLNLAAQINDDGFVYYLEKNQKTKLFPKSFISYVNRLKEIVLINDVYLSEINFEDEYIKKNEPKSILAIPLVLNSELKSIIYLENFDQKNIFSNSSIETIKLLSTQMVISIENSYFYEKLESLVDIRTKDLENTLSLFDMGQMLLFKWQNEDNWPVSYLSNNVESILGYKKERFLKGEINYLDIIHDEDKKNVIDEVKNASLNHENLVVHKTYRIKDSKGSYLWVYDSTKIIYDEKGNVSYYLGYIVDITKEKKRENYLLQQTKMVALGEMIGNIAHQWRQPLSIVSTSASSLKLKKELNVLNDEDINEVVQIIMDTVQDLSHTIDEFRDFLCVDKTVFNDYFLNDIIVKAYKMLNHFFINYNIKINKDVPKDLKIKCSESQLVQVFINILSNAKDALLLNNYKSEKVISIKAYKKLNKIHVLIKDNAGGIDEEIIEKIFEPYFTTKHQSQGTGMGLYLTHQIITNELEGEIEVHNEEFLINNKYYKGACFSIVLSE